MRGLFFKILCLLWISQTLILVISLSLIISRRIPSQGLIYSDPGRLRSQSVSAIEAYNAGGCAGFNDFAASHQFVAGLVDEAGSAVCSAPGFKLPAHFGATEELSAQMFGASTLWSVPTVSRGGKRFNFVIAVSRTRPPGLLNNLIRYSMPQLPVAIAVAGVTTFVLVLIFTRPVIRLRKAANQLARGNLGTRVKQSKWSAFLAGEEFGAMVRDFNQMAERLESLVNAQKLLLRDVSHELRSPLARLSVALELARSDADQTMGTHLNRIEREAERLNQLIGQLLTLASMEATENLEKQEHVSLNQLLRDILPDAEYEAQQRGADVALEEKCQATVDGRRELLYRAIENVVRNAIRYTKTGSQVEIQVYRDQPGQMAVVEVSDRGPGIPESELESIFLPFYRIDIARAAQTGGFGVGLAIAERAVKLHEGRIRALNRAGGGTTVQIVLPVVPA